MRHPKHRQIFEHIHQAILSGQYAAGDQLPTDSQWMRQFQTSRPTVARALHDLEQAGLVQRRPGSGTFVRVPTDVHAKVLGLLIPGLGETEIFEPICGQIARSCHRHHFNLLWGDTPITAGDQRQQAEALCQRYLDQQVAGVFFAPMELTPGMQEANRRIAEAFRSAGIAVVLLDRDLKEYPRRSEFDLVGIDNFHAGFIQAEHLLGLGCRRLHYVALAGSAATVDARIAGYRHAMAEHGVAAEDGWIHRDDPRELDVVRRILAERPEGLLCANDITAAHLMQSLARLGVQVPDEVRVVGMDDVKYAQLLGVPLTTLHQPCREIGEAAISVMLERLENGSAASRAVLLHCRLVVRQSCGGGR